MAAKFLINVGEKPQELNRIHFETHSFSVNCSRDCGATPRRADWSRTTSVVPTLQSKGEALQSLTAFGWRIKSRRDFDNLRLAEASRLRAIGARERAPGGDWGLGTGDWGIGELGNWDDKFLVNKNSCFLYGRGLGAKKKDE